MKRAFQLLYIFFIFFVHSAAAQSINTIVILENGNTHWTIERQLPLDTQPEINEWNLYIAKGEGFYRLQRDNQEFIDRIYSSLKFAETSTGRRMNIENFNITYETKKTISGTFGLIRFNFDWTNFSVLNSTTMLIGDAFVENMILYPENVLIIQIPEGYKLMSSEPEFDKIDGNRLIWDGTMYRNFEKGGPEIVLEKRKNITSALIPVLLAVFLILIAFARKKNQLFPAVLQTDDIIQQSPHSDSAEFIGDEDLVAQLLKKNKGQMFQIDIVKESGYSKSKISSILKKMKEDEKILKIKKGRGNLIKLVDRSAEDMLNESTKK